jgi:hypothetical protein
MPLLTEVRKIEFMPYFACTVGSKTMGRKCQCRVTTEKPCLRQSL